MQHRPIFAWLAEVFINVSHIRRIDRLHADEDPLAARCGDQINQLFILQQVGTNLRDPRQLRIRGNDVAQQRLRALNVDGQIVVNEENRDLAALFACPLFESQEFIYDALIGAEADRVAKESGHSTKLAAIGTTSSGFHRHDMKRSPSGAQAGHEWTKYFRHQTELV